MYTDTEKRENVVRGLTKSGSQHRRRQEEHLSVSFGGQTICKWAPDGQGTRTFQVEKRCVERQDGETGSAGQQAHSLGGMGSQTAGVEAAEDGPLPDEQLWTPPLLSLVAHFF